MNILDRLLFDPTGGMLREFFGVKTYLEPKDHSLYRRLLPEPFSMPDQPIVMIFVADYAKVFWPIPRYRELAVVLKGICKGEEAWHVITMPVTKWLPMLGGRYLGFPKYIAEEITLTRDGENWNAQGRHKGVLQLALEFQPGITRQLAQWEKELLGMRRSSLTMSISLFPLRGALGRRKSALSTCFRPSGHPCLAWCVSELTEASRGPNSCLTRSRPLVSTITS